MTREQAINYLFSCGFTNEQVGEVVRALTYEPTTKNDLGVDCISRADARHLIAESFRKNLGITFNKFNEMFKTLYEGVDNLPSVTPQEPCDKCEVGNPCLYCKHEFEPQESEDKK